MAVGHRYIRTATADKSLTGPRKTLVSAPGSADSAVEPQLRFYKSQAGYSAIMAWYENALDGIDVELQSRYVQTRFGRTHMLGGGPEDGEAPFPIPGPG